MGRVKIHGYPKTGTRQGNSVSCVNNLLFLLWVCLNHRSGAVGVAYPRSDSATQCLMPSRKDVPIYDDSNMGRPTLP